MAVQLEYFRNGRSVTCMGPSVLHYICIVYWLWEFKDFAKQTLPEVDNLLQCLQEAQLGFDSLPRWAQRELSQTHSVVISVDDSSAASEKEGLICKNAKETKKQSYKYMILHVQNMSERMVYRNWRNSIPKCGLYLHCCDDLLLLKFRKCPAKHPQIQRSGIHVCHANLLPELFVRKPFWLH